MVSGTVRFTSGDASFDALARTLVMVPPGAPHSFANPGDEPAVVLNTFTPDLYIGYFRELRDQVTAGRPLSPELIGETMRRYATWSRRAKLAATCACHARMIFSRTVARDSEGLLSAPSNALSAKGGRQAGLGADRASSPAIAGADDRRLCGSSAGLVGREQRLDDQGIRRLPRITRGCARRTWTSRRTRGSTPARDPELPDAHSRWRRASSPSFTGVFLVDLTAEEWAATRALRLLGQLGGILLEVLGGARGQPRGQDLGRRAEQDDVVVAGRRGPRCGRAG